MKRYIVSLLLILAGFFKAQAGLVTFTDTIRGQGIATGKTLEVLDDRHNYMIANGGWASDFTNYNVNDRITLKFTDAIKTYYSSNWDATVYFTYDSWGAGGGVIATAVACTLKVSYDPAVGLKYRDAHVYTATLGHRTKLTITNVTMSGISVLPPDLILESEIEVERYFAFDQTVTPTVNYSLSITEEPVVFYWPFQYGAEDYDLEWVFVSQYDQVSLLSPDFSKATRVTVKGLYYRVNLVYDLGTIFYRLRGVGRFGSSFDCRQEGTWSATGSYAVVTTYDDKRNWQYDASYAELGKRKEVVSFFDGSSRQRQSVTVSNTINTALVAEKFYDYEGRESIQTLPAPNHSFDSHLGFYSAFNKNTSTNLTFSAKDFDNDGLFTSCVQGATPGMKDNEGASKYYSDQNTAKTLGFTAAVPDANNYPYSQTVYGIDGRVKKQSGVGTDHKISSGKETQYFYATPLQYKLDQLFGNNVGFARHYSEKAVVDANGQMSISYSDLKGNVIATALAGEKPSNVDALPSYASNAIVANFNDQNQYSQTDTGYVIRTSFLVTNPGTNYDFNYTLTTETYASLCASTTHDCVYDLEITVYDACNQIVNDNTVNPAHYRLTINSSPYSKAFTIVFPTVGTYTIVKKLTLNQAALQTELGVFLAALPGDCITPLNDLQSQYASTLDSSECFTCDENCERQATANGLVGGAWTTFVNDCKTNTCLYDSLSETANCDAMLDIFAMDLSPGGQYFDNVPAYSTSSPSNTWFAANVWADGAGAWTTADFRDPSNTLITTWANLKANWESGWALRTFTAVSGKTQLVQYHPEICQYSWCTATEPSQLFDNFIGQHYTYLWSSTYPSTTNPYVDIGQSPVGTNMLNADPYFTTSPGTADATAMSGLLTNDGSGSPMWTDAGTIAGCSNCDDQWQVFRALYLYWKKKLMDARNLSANSCYPLYDATSPPDDIADATSCGTLFPPHPPNCNPSNVQGFFIRVPDRTDDIETIMAGGGSAATAFGTAAGDQYNICKRADSIVYTLSSFSCAGTMTVSLTSNAVGGIGLTAHDITGGLCCINTTTINALAQSIVTAINTYVPTGDLDFTAKINPSNPASFIVYAPSSIGSGGGAITLTFASSCSAGGSGVTATYSGASNHLGGGLDNATCPPILNCLCGELADMVTTYNGTDPNTMADYIDHTTYPTVEDYIADMFNTHYSPSPSITTTQVEHWLSNCCASNNSNPATHLFGTYTCAAPYDHPANEPVPLSIDCSTQPGCMEDAANITDFYAQQDYNNSISNAANNFIAEYTHQCFYGSNYSEDFTVSFEDIEHHFTLYYYDQGNNLIRTVPPQAVQLLSSSDVNDADNHRNDPLTYPTSYFPTHDYWTDYTYNSYHQPIEQTTPDGGTTDYLYDLMGRIGASQNAKQYADLSAFGSYVWSYTVYDEQGRISEVGEAWNSTPLTQAKVEDPALFLAWIGTSTRFHVTQTYYDDVIPGSSFSFTQTNLRSRVASVTIEATYDGNDLTYDNATHYSYDIHGNVSLLVQDNPLLSGYSLDLKKITYEYDLVSGNVNAVHYQDGEPDQFHHKYYYDADNRITNVYTSVDKVVWKQDEKYFYYIHGPLARTEVGHEKVQGQDYFYHIQGWIKGVNANTLVMASDLGKDGVDDATGTGAYSPALADLHSNVAEDALGYSLHYYGSDWSPVNSAVGTVIQTNTPNNSGDDLFNGNIKQMSTALMKPNGSSLPIPIDLIATEYHYDQLNRIKNMNAFITSSITSYSAASNSGDYHEAYTYDANGNILKLLRNGPTSPHQDMDSMDYVYTTNTNMLDHVRDNVNPAYYSTDIDDQSGANYTYDEIGNLKTDAQEEIDTITWSPYGKVLRVARSSGSNKDDLAFLYDATGNRECKIQKPRSGGSPGASSAWVYTFYVRDAQGNVMATYDKRGTGAGLKIKLEELHIYGSSRAGIRKRVIDMISPPGATAYCFDSLGWKQYELSNHLGNVLVTVSDKKLPHNTSGPLVDYYKPEVINTQDYYSFGMEMPGRVYTGSSNYRYGFNGHEQDNELKSNGNSYDFGARIYDPRLGRMLSIDRFNNVYPDLSPYNGMANSPLVNVDVEGNLIIFINGFWGIPGVTGDGHDGDCFLELEDYWDIKVLTNAAKTFNDYQAVYFNASDGLVSSIADSRQSKGAGLGETQALWFKMMLDKQRSTPGSEGATLNFVGHSQGAAYEVGLINALSDATYPSDYFDENLRGKKIFKPSDFGEAYFLGAYQTDKLTAPSATKNTQINHSNDIAGNTPMINIKANGGKFLNPEYQTLNGWVGGVAGGVNAHLNANYAGNFPKTGFIPPANMGGKGPGAGHVEHTNGPLPREDRTKNPQDNTSHINPRFLK